MLDTIFIILIVMVTAVLVIYLAKHKRKKETRKNVVRYPEFYWGLGIVAIIFGTAFVIFGLLIEKTSWKYAQIFFLLLLFWASGIGIIIYYNNYIIEVQDDCLRITALSKKQIKIIYADITFVKVSPTIIRIRCNKMKYRFIREHLNIDIVLRKIPEEKLMYSIW